MTYTILGFKSLSFTPKEGNGVITGYNLYVSYHTQGVDGVACERFFFSEAKADRCQFVPRVGAEVEVSFNRFGKPDYIEEV